jgi:hypothetical protein
VSPGSFSREGFLLRRAFMAAKQKSSKKPGRPKDLSRKAIDPKKTADVRGGRRVDFTEAYIKPVRLPK